MADDHAGNVALVTGGSSGIGRATALRLAEQGASVAINSVDAAGVAEVVSEITAAGGQALPVVCSVTDYPALAAGVARVLDRWGHLDVLVTSAGVQRYGSVDETTEAAWDEVFAINVKGTFLAVKACLPALRETGHGAIAIVSSVQGTATQNEVVAYTAGKGALNAFMRAVAVDEAPHGVRVNAVCPGSVDTPMLRSSAALFAAGRAPDDLVAEWGAAHPIGRVARPAEIADAICYLTGPRASFVTGVELRVDGGLLARLAVALPGEGG